MTDINILIVVGLRAPSVNRELAKVAIDCSADGIALNMFDSLPHLPRYSETFENRGTPSSVATLRAAAAEADAVLIVTTYHGRVPAAVHNAIDWLTRRWDQAALHDKPLAVIGRASGCYSGVWSHQPEDADRIAAPRVIDSITVTDLRRGDQEARRRSARRRRGSRDGICRRCSPTTEIGESMRHKAIAAALGAAPLLAMGITAAEESVKSGYSIDGAGTTVTQGPDPNTMTSESFSPVAKATPPCGFTIHADCAAISGGCRLDTTLLRHSVYSTTIRMAT